MHDRTARFLEHPLHARLAALRTTVMHLDNGARAELKSETSHLRKILHVVTARLERADPDLARISILDELLGRVDAITSLLRGGGQEDLISANAEADACLDHIDAIYHVATVAELDGIREAMQHFRSRVRAAYLEAEQEVQSGHGLLKALRDLHNRMTAELTRIGGMITSESERFAAAMDASEQARDAEYHKRESDRDDASRIAVQEFDKHANEMLDAWQSAGAELKDEMRATLDGVLGEARLRADSVVAEMRGHEERAKELLGIVGGTGIATGYQRTADQARRTTALWQVVTVISMTALIVFAYTTFLPTLAGPFSWQTFAARIFVSLTTGVLAAYAAHQAATYHAVESNNRQRALQFASFEPYLAALPREKQDDLRVFVARKTFTTMEHVAEAVTVPHPPASVIDVILKSKELREMITALVSRASGA